MAFGMRHWIAVTLAGMALVAAWRLPAEPAALPDREVRPAERIRYDALMGEAGTTMDILFRIMWADSLSALAVAEGADDGLAVMLPDLGPGTDEQTQRLAGRIRAQLDRRVPNGSPMVFGYAIQPHNHRRADGANSARERTETYVGTRDGVDYCLQVRVSHEFTIEETVADRLVGIDDDAAPVTDELGPCRFYLAHGLPGAAVQAWLERGAVEFALEAHAVEPFPGRDANAFYADRRGIFGLGYAGPGGQPAMVDRCLAGIETACGAFFQIADHDYLLTRQQREVVRRSPATGIGSKFGPFTAMRDQRYILADLEADFGSEAFHAFWTSDEEVGEAFEAAFGMPAGEWMVQRIDRLIGVDEPGPAVSRKTSTGVMLAFGLFLGIAWLRRRERGVVS